MPASNIKKSTWIIFFFAIFLLFFVQILDEEKLNYFSRNVFILLYLKFELDDYNELESVILEDSLKQKAEIS